MTVTVNLQDLVKLSFMNEDLTPAWELPYKKKKKKSEDRLCAKTGNLYYSETITDRMNEG